MKHAQLQIVMKARMETSWVLLQKVRGGPFKAEYEVGLQSSLGSEGMLHACEGAEGHRCLGFGGTAMWLEHCEGDADVRLEAGIGRTQ